MHEKTFSIKTLGCKCNQYESAQIASQLLASGFTAVPFGSLADIVIINTCTVTDKSNKKCRNYIRQGARFSKSGGVIVTGCMVQTHKHEIEAMDEVIAAYNNEQKGQFISLIGTIDTIKQKSLNHFETKNSPFALPYMRTRGYIKIQDGCDGHCSYCIVPVVRGVPQSRPIDDVINHARYLIDSQCPEIVLTGITIGKYHDKGYSLAQLIEKIVQLDGNFRVRVTSVEPVHVDDALVAMLAHDKVCKHIHLPLQSGSDAVLTLMRRPYSFTYYMHCVEKIKKVLPDIAVGTDIIVGYPAEGDSDFALTLQAVTDCQFAYIHQFTYSPREGTVSSKCKTIPHDIVAMRAEQLRNTAQKYSLQYKKQFINATREAVIEKSNDNIIALTDNYLKIKLENNHHNRSKVGQLLPVTITNLASSGLQGKIAGYN